jgi:hypothetical protein
MTRTIGGIPYKETFQSSGTEQEGRDKVKSDMLNSDRLARSYITKFQKLKEEDPETYKKYLDTDNNGVVSPQEERATTTASNPILQWAQDTYWHKALDMKLSQPSKNVVSTSGGGFSFNFGGQKITSSPAVKRTDPVTYGGESYLNSYRFNKPIPIGNVPTKGGIRYSRSATHPLGEGNVQGFIKDYLPDDDMVTIEVKKAYGAANVESGEFIAVPANSIPDVNSLPIIQEGQQTTIGALRESKPAPKVKPTYPEWKKANPNGTVADYNKL